MRFVIWYEAAGALARRYLKSQINIRKITVKLLDRYVLRNFLQAYFYCIAAFFSIWLIFDISDNISTFSTNVFHSHRVLHYYLTQVPQILVILLPVSLLLALLFCLGRMSRTNEIVSMLTAGVSLPRVLLPLIFIGVITSLGMAALKLLSRAACGIGAQRSFEEETHGRKVYKGLVGQIFRNRTDNRTWFIQLFRPGENEFHNVQVLQQDENDNIVTQLSREQRRLSPGGQILGAAKSQSGGLRRGGKHQTRAIPAIARHQRLERDAVSTGERECARGFTERAGAARVSAFQFGFSRRLAGALFHAFPISPRASLDLSGRRLYRRAARDWFFAPRNSFQRRNRDRPRLLHEFSYSSLSRAR